MGLKELRDVKLQIREQAKTYLHCKQTHNAAATCPTGRLRHHAGLTKQSIPDEEKESESATNIP